MKLSSLQRVTLLSLEMLCYCRESDHLIEVKYNEFSKLGNLNGDRVHLIQVTVK